MGCIVSKDSNNSAIEASLRAESFTISNEIKLLLLGMYLCVNMLLLLYLYTLFLYFVCVARVEGAYFVVVYHWQWVPYSGVVLYCNSIV